MTRFVDANVFIYVLTMDPEFYGAAEAILRRVEGGEEAVTSTLVLEEVFVFLKARRAAHRIPRVLEYIRSFTALRIIPYLLEDMAAATALMEELSFRMDLDDALIAATMRRLGLSEIYSNDAHFDIIPGIERSFQ